MSGTSGEDGASPELTEARVREVLAEVRYPSLDRDVVSLGLLRSVAVRNGRIHVSLVVSTSKREVRDQLRAAIKEALSEAGAVRTEVQIRPPRQTKGIRGDPWSDRGRLPGVRRIVAVGSGKGGVGKSTVAANLALSLRRGGARVGVLDADIYGPSLPVVLGVEDGRERVEVTDDRIVLPLEVHGLHVVSFGFFLGEESPAVWRGPMVGKAVKQFSRGVRWPELDILVVDLPPGTGDVPLSLAQSVVVDAGIVVTTPQRLSVLEARKAAEMFRKLRTPLLGVVENLSYSRCGCGRTHHPFGEGGGARLAEEEGTRLLGRIPFLEGMVEGEDRGESPVLTDPDGEAGRAFDGLAAEVREALDENAAGAASGTEGSHAVGDDGRLPVVPAGSQT